MHIYIEEDLSQKVIRETNKSERENMNISVDEQINSKYNVVISNFEGPLDLLCFLISKNKMDIFDISLSEVTDKYLEYLSEMQSLDMEIATEFIVMASTLLYIKSKKLIPLAEPEEEQDDEMTEQDLIDRITKYKMYKEKQEILRKMYDENFGSFEKLPEKIKIRKKINFNNFLLNFNIEETYKNILQRQVDKINKKSEEVERIAIYEKVTIKSKVIKILEELKKKTSFVFNKMFSVNKENKIDIVTAFLGVLELSRLKQVELKQENMFGEIEVKKISSRSLDVSLIKE